MHQAKNTTKQMQQCKPGTENEGKGNRRRIRLRHWDNIDWRSVQQSAHTHKEGGWWRTVVSFMRRDSSHSLTPFRSRLTPTRPSFPRLLISWSGFTTSLWRRRINMVLFQQDQQATALSLIFKVHSGFDVIVYSEHRWLHEISLNKARKQIILYNII